MIFYLILGFLFALLAAIFAIQNPTSVNVRFMTWNIVDGSLALVLLIFYGLGVVSGLLFMLQGSLKARAQLALQKRKIDSLAKMAQPPSA